MNHYRPIAALVFGAFLLSGCTSGLAGGDVTDAVISRAAQFSDRALDDLEAAEDFLRQKTDRLARAKCRFPFTALVRYACKNEANRVAVEANCGLAVKCAVGAAAVTPGEPAL